jgi:hypothetical protein
VTWVINPTVTIGVTDYTSNVLNGVSITYGRTIIWEQPRAGYATIQIKNSEDTILTAEINDQVIITADDSNGNPVTLFTGRLNSINSQVAVSGSNAIVVIHTITAIAPMSEMARVITHTSSWPKEYDDDRISRIFTDAGITVDVVDTPGVYEFTSSPANPKDCYTEAAYYAGMAFGYIYETTDGKVGYANESRRTIEAQTYGYFVIPENIIIGAGVSSAINTNNLINDLRLEYKASAVVTATSASSISLYGKAAADIKTELEDSVQAQNQADRYITLRSVPLAVLNAFTVQLSAPTIVDADLDELLAIYMGKPVQISDLPNGIHNGIYQGFVEGWTMVLAQNQAALTLNVSENSLSLAPTRWQDVAPTLIWSNVNAALEWSDYE